MPTYSGIRSTDQAAPGAKFRASWARTFFSRNSFFPPSALQAVTAVQEGGPGRGFFLVSSPAVSPGDDAIVLDVKTQTSWKGTAAALATALDGVVGSGFQLEGLKLIPPAETATSAAADREKVQAVAEKQVDTQTVGGVVAGVASGIKSTVLLIAGAIALLALVVYAPQLKAAGRAVTKAARKVRT